MKKKKTSSITMVLCPAPAMTASLPFLALPVRMQSAVTVTEPLAKAHILWSPLIPMCWMM